MTSLSKCVLFQRIARRSLLTPSRNLSLQEYQSKALLQQHNVNIQKFRVLDSDTNKTALKDFHAKEYVIKAQVLAGGRGKGHFDNGFKGGVHLTKNVEEVFQLADKMVGNRLITQQTPKDGILVRKVMVAESVNIVRETYLCILLDRQHNGPVLVASPAGGMDIEKVAADTPELIKTMPIDIFEGVTREMAEEVASFLKFDGELKSKCADEITKLWKLFLEVDAVQLEINPLVETDDNQVISVDAKINFDDNAKFRQKEVFAMDDTSESDPREVEAAKHNLNYIGMEGNVGCLVNGAGLAMATMDMITLSGGKPANFLDVGGAVGEEQVKAAFKLLAADENVKAILVNVFGGIVNCATIARGIIAACRSMELGVPLVVRLEGTNVGEARQLLHDSKLPIREASDLDKAAALAVKN
ncbi:succinyl-coenzyme A synthetase beta subunit, GDP-forming [Arctopsyche grandis]|uniref:succinyl-coenzyme A synthetase beta subunit, GDP-forming n=1 Tax=Arctopsyche grandis TaxID=121162 RepID=UPI00406D97B5